MEAIDEKKEKSSNFKGKITIEIWIDWEEPPFVTIKSLNGDVLLDCDGAPKEKDLKQKLCSSDKLNIKLRNNVKVLIVQQPGEDDVIQELINRADQRGYLTYDDVIEVLEEDNDDLISLETILYELDEMGIEL